MKKTMYMIGNAHLDPVWLWRWPEGFSENKATMRSMLERLSEFDDVVFTSSSAQFYEWIEENDPDMFEQIRRRVDQGRWIICGGWWVQPDCNIPCGESFARHALIGQNYLVEKFGKMSTVGYCVDSFGHAGTLPQILRQSGMDSYVFMRPMRHEKPIHDNLFTWRSQDGSQVMAYRIPFSYNAHAGIEQHIRDCGGEFSETFPGMMCFYGVGNHGGGPTIANIRAVHGYQKTDGEIDYVFSDPVRFFADVKRSGAALPVVTEDLQHHAVGCYSALSAVKAANRRAENALLRAEKACAAAHALLGMAYPGRELERGWKNVLFNQFHDIIAGTCVREAYDDALDTYAEACAIAARAENNALQAISSKIDIPDREGEIPMVVFNPHPWQTVQPVELERGPFLNTRMPPAYQVCGPDGRVCAHQQISPHVQHRSRERIVFEAELPPMGYALYTIRPRDGEPLPLLEADDPYVLENDHLRASFSRDSGALASLIKKPEGIEILSGEAAVGTVLHDSSDTWSHHVTRFDQECGFFRLKSISRREAGPVRDTVRVVREYGQSLLIQDFTLYRSGRQLHVAVTVDWRERLKCLKLDFPVKLTDCFATYEAPFGSIAKEANGEEEPMQSWADITGKAPGGETAGLCLINDAKYSASAQGDKLSFLVLRSPVYSHHTPASLEGPAEDYAYIDQGIQRFQYTVLPHTGNALAATPARRGMELCQQPVVVMESFHRGKLPGVASFLSVGPENVSVSAWKQARDGDGYILRLYETCGKRSAVSVKLAWLDRDLSFDIGPHEIKTLRIGRDGDFGLTDFLENDQWRG